MSFFLKKKSRHSRTVALPKKRKEHPTSKAPSTKKRAFNRDDDVLSDDSDVEVDKVSEALRLQEIQDEEEIDETPQERKLRLAKKYLEEIEKEEKERLETQDVDQALLGDRVGQERKVVKRLDIDYAPIDSTENFVFVRNVHRLPVTCVAISPTGKYLISGGKDGRLAKYEFPSGKKMQVAREHKKVKGSEEAPPGHTSGVACIAFSSDGKYLASCDGSNIVFIWDPEKLEIVHRFTGHRGPVTGVVFRRSTYTLYSCSEDRAVKVWDAAEQCYVESLFGHQEKITSIDSLIRERALTAGGRDSTVRVWKIPEESQLVFQGNAGHSIDIARFLDEQHFVSGGEDGSISLWGLMRKKPLYSIESAHGRDALSSLPNWISSIACLQNSDLFATGSCDGSVRIWRSGKKILQVFSIPVQGFVNCLEFSQDGDYLVVAIGQEHRLGRWWKLKEVKNQVIIIPLQKIDK